MLLSLSTDSGWTEIKITNGTKPDSLAAIFQHSPFVAYNKLDLPFEFLMHNAYTCCN